MTVVSAVLNQTLAFNSDNMFANFLCKDRVAYEIDKVVDGVDIRVDALEALNLLSDSHLMVLWRLKIIRGNG